MSFYNGVPITAVSGLQHMLTPTESTSRRRAADEACLKTTGPSAPCDCQAPKRD